MAVNTLSLRAAMTRVLFYIIVSRIMTLPTKTVIGVFKSTAMRIVTIHAGNSFLIHTTLHKGSEHEHLIIDLTIGKIQALFQQTDSKLLTIRMSGMNFTNNAASRMTTATHSKIAITLGSY